MPKVSVIIPVYNDAQFLRRTLDSVIKQSLEDIEIICIDDCSNDGCIMGPLSRPRSKILRVAVSRIILSSEASKVKLVGNLVA